MVWTGHREGWTHRLLVFLQTHTVNPEDRWRPRGAQAPPPASTKKLLLHRSEGMRRWQETREPPAQPALKEPAEGGGGGDTCSSVSGILAMQNSQLLSLYLHFQLRCSGISFLIIRSLHLPNGQGTSKKGHTFRWSYKEAHR